jgi:PEP-CTERM motif
MKNFGPAGVAILALALSDMPAPAKAATVTDIISFSDIGTYQVSGGGFYNADAVASGSFNITFDPTQVYLTQSIAGIISNLIVSVTDDRFAPPNLTLNPITTFAFDGAGTLTLYSNAALNKTLDNTPNITIGINGWAYSQSSSVWYSQTNFLDTLTTSGDVSIAQTPLPAALPLFAGGLGVIGLLGWRRKRKVAAAT